ncbi:MAG: DegV family protein [Chloroflexota bacterium]
MVRVVSDSTCDLVPELAHELRIHVVPLYVSVGDRTYRDGVDLDSDGLYRELRAGRVPRTSAPSPGDFVAAYRRLAGRSKEIISIHLAEGYSGTMAAARLASTYVTEHCQVRVIDSRSVSVGLGSVVLAAARAARSGAGLAQVTEVAEDAASRCRLYGKLDDFGYLFRGRRFRLTRWLKAVGRTSAFVRVKVVGEAYEGGRIRSPRVVLGQSMALRALESLARRPGPVEEVVIGYSTAPEEAQMLAVRLGGLVPEDRIVITRIGAVTSTYVGPGTLVMAARGAQG